jgi:hypothetical protein
MHGHRYRAYSLYKRKMHGRKYRAYSLYRMPKRRLYKMPKPRSYKMRGHRSGTCKSSDGSGTCKMPE